MRILSASVVMLLGFMLAGEVVGEGRTSQDEEPVVSTVPPTPLSVQVVITRQQQGKAVSRVPYVLSVNSDGQFSRLRMSTRVPLAAGLEQMATYEDVGTSIDCRALRLEDGRYRLTISIDDSSVASRATEGHDTPRNAPSFRSFKSTQHLILRDGESTRYTMATDKITGEVIQIEVALAIADKKR